MGRLEEEDDIEAHEGEDIRTYAGGDATRGRLNLPARSFLDLSDDDEDLDFFS
jgi:phage gpG-like protein